MASVNEPGLVKVVVERPGISSKDALQFDTTSAINAGKSPDGALANVTSDKQMKTAKVMPIIRRGDIIHLMFKPKATDGIDVSDCVVLIPYWENGMFKHLTMTDFGATVDLAGAVADNWVELGSGYIVPNNVEQAQLGGGDIVISIEDDTA